jgi:hypothetical protein
MRRHSQYGWHWTRSYAPDGSERYTVPRRAVWDLRCEEPTCARVRGRMTPRWAPKRRRTRVGERRH